MTQIVYLHGFASSPNSGKAQFFRRKFAERGVTFEIPQLDDGRFESLTISGQLEVIERAVGEQPAILIGSSLGGYLAALYASRHSKIERLVLLAPAFQFPRRWRERYSPEDWQRWQREGSTPVFHYGDKQERRLGYQFVEDTARYEDEPVFSQPALILHGVHDNVVPAVVSEAYAARHANVKLVLMESGHELTDVLEPMWLQIWSYLNVPESIELESINVSVD